MTLPVLFLGHGSPMNAIRDTPYSRNWRALGDNLRQQYGDRIRAILMISAHWCTNGSAVSASPAPRTIHDFSGFPQALFDMRYPAPGSPALAKRVRALLGHNVRADTDWGLDHGAWGVLCHLYPDASLPVVQLSLDLRLDSAAHFALAQRLAPLRDEGVLIIGSGDIVHNLRLMDRHAPDRAGEGYAWAENARSLVNHWLISGDTQALTDEAAYPEDIFLAAPTPDHWWPLLYAAGAANEKDSVLIFNDDIVGKSLSMTSVIFGDATLLPAA